MITDRNKFNFVTICIGLSFLLTAGASVASAQAAASNAQPETTQQQEQAKNQPAIATISVVSNKDESANAIVNEPTNSVGHAFSPRLDYSNEWRPVGRGDPLKNDPTFDYSPPTLEHVRYWAETTKDGDSKEESGGNSKQDTNSVRYAQPNKQDILLLGMPNEHLRNGGVTHTPQTPHQHAHVGQHASQHSQQFYHQPHPGVMKNAKGETPLLQPKYTSVRRSYYAQQLPTRLMPPPMQALNSPPINTFNVPMKPSQVHTEYRHSMPAMPSHVSTVPSAMSSVSHMKAQHYPSMSTATSPPSWMYSSPPTMQRQQQHHHYAVSGGAPSSMSISSQSTRMPPPHAYDSHPQDSHHYFSYTRPSSNSISSHPSHESYSPNSLRHSGSGQKQTVAGRKPWLHELLQKEVVKTTVKPSFSVSPNKFAYETTKPVYERMPTTSSISNGFTSFTPVTFVSAPPTIATTTTTTTRAPQTPSVPITPTAFHSTTSTTLAPLATSTRAHVIYTTPTTTTTTPRTTTSTTSSRLLIPTSSNLAFRPTVAPMRMTTDSLFSHYKQPDSPLRGPMYLIIEGHSKVKKYGKNGINLNLPKIVPVIPKREPVVRVAEPGEEKRGTPETFQVEHLHVKTSTTTTTPKPTTTAKAISSTTAKPTMKLSNISKPSATVNPSAARDATKTTLKAVVSSTTTTARPAVTTATPKRDSTTIATSKVTTTPAIVKPPTSATKPTPNEPLIKLELPNDPPTGMQGLLSLLDSSLSGIFAEQPLQLTDKPAPPQSAHLNQTKQTTTENIAVTTASTVLQAVKSQVNTVAIAAPSAVIPVAPDARIGSNAGRIVAADTDQSGSAEFSFTTDMPPREVRQVFDYDQRPESRLKDFIIESFDGEGLDGDASAFYDDEFEEYADDDANSDVINDGSQQPIKRIDRFVEGEEGEFVGDYEDVELGDVVQNANSAHTA